MRLFEMLLEIGGPLVRPGISSQEKLESKVSKAEQHSSSYRSTTSTDYSRKDKQ